MKHIQFAPQLKRLPATRERESRKSSLQVLQFSGLLIMDTRKEKDEAYSCEIKLRENPQRQKEKVYIGCGAGFRGDRPLAALKLLQRVKELDYLVLECLAERTLVDRYQVMMKGGKGFDPKISDWMSLLLPLAVERGVCVITNMGAMDPHGAQVAVLDVASSLGLDITVSVAYEVALTNSDIDECNTGSNLCLSIAACKNRVPGYACVCPNGTIGDGFKLRNGCHKPFPLPQAILATSAFIVFWIPCLTFSYWVRKKNNEKKLKGKYYQQNGGFLLKECFFSSTGTSRKSTKSFSARELRKATDNYNSKRILVSGCQGTVYKGTLDDGSTVAIKKSYAVAQNQVDQFIEEIVILTQINHKNIATLLGCCLETQAPFIVYEFISGETLYQKLHGDANDSTPLSWKTRLQIVTEIAEALSHLHSCASMSSHPT